MAGRDFVTGKAIFARDHKFPQMLYAKVLRSPHAYAKIASIDTSAAEALEGVRAVLTYKNCPDWKMGMPFPHMRMLSDTVRYIGDGVALVAADTEDIAEEAIDLIEVEYEVMKPVLTFEEAMAEGAPQLYPEIPNNIVPTKMFEDIGFGFQQLHYGDVEAGFAEADLIIENTAHLKSGQNPLPHEAPGVVAQWTGDDLLVTGSMSSAGLCKMMNAPYMNLPISGMRVVPDCVGGSFGSKHLSSNGIIILYAAALAKATGRPVALHMTKEEHLTVHTLRMPVEGRYKIGFKKDGTVTAIQGEELCGAGYYGSEQGLMIAVGLIEVPIASNCPNVSLDTKLIVTNTMSSGAYRGYGWFEQGAVLINAIMRGVQQLDINPIDYLRKTALKPGDKLFHAYMMSGFIEAHGPCYLNLLEAAAETFGWNERWLGWGKNTVDDKGKIHAIGVGLEGMSDVGEQISNCAVDLEFDGHVLVNSGVTEFGTGTRDVIRMIAAEEMNVPLENVRLAPCDTGANPYEWGSTGCRSTCAIGGCVQKACKDAKSKLFEKAAQILQCPPEILDTKDGEVFIKGNPEAKIPWVAAIEFNGCITGVASTKPYYNAQAYHVHFVEIAVDPETGKVELVELVNSGDLGKVVNPQGIKAQFDGYLPGIDVVTREETVTDSSGRIMNPNLIDYRTHTFNELPKHQSICMETPPEDGGLVAPFGAIGGGELSIGPAVPAVTMALYNATGTWFDHYPITFGDILEAMKKN